MKNIVISIVFVFSFQQMIVAQTESLQINGEIGIRGKWQTGNFAQFVINPTGKIVLEKKRNRIEIQANYEFLKVNNGSLINDFWAYGLYQYNADKTIFPMAMIHYGFSQAYAIDHSFIGGLGIGINLIKNEQHQFLQVHVFTGYLNLKYQSVPKHTAASFGSYVRLKFPLKKDKIYAILDSHAYLSIKNSAYHSFNSRATLLFQVLENFGVNVIYSLVYNNNNPSVLSKTNGKLVFGLNYAFNK